MFESRDDLISEIARELQREPADGNAAAAKARILEAVRDESPGGRLAAAWRWLRSPRTLRLSPLGGLAAVAGVAALAGVVVLGAGSAYLARESPTVASSSASAASQTSSAALADSASQGARGAPAPAASPGAATAPAAEPARRVVQFVLVAPSASRVSLVGDFNGWDARATPLNQASTRGLWAVEIPLEPGRHAYAFVVDGSAWVADPAAARAPGDDFGAPSSVIVVGEVGHARSGGGAT